MSREKVISLMFSGFLVYFALFTLVLYPYREYLHPEQSADYLQTVLPSGFKWFIAMYRNWTFTTFYVMSELWGNIVLFVLFWGFANQITRLNEAKRFYGLFGISGNLSGVVAGVVSVYFSRNVFNPQLPFGSNAWDQSLFTLVSIVVFVGIATLLVFRWLNTHVLTDPLYQDKEATAKDQQVIGKLSFRDNFAYLLRSRYLLSIAVIVISYNVVINLVEVLWKHEVHELYPNSNDYSVYMNHVSTIIGAIATLNALIVSGNCIRAFGWTFTALLTPAILVITSIGFFLFFFIKEYQLDVGVLAMGIEPLAMVVLFGSAQNVLSRAAKYSVFDATKEMAFIPLGAECRLKGKAAIDGVCSRMGKSGGAFIHQTLLLKLGSFVQSAPYVAVVLVSIITIWVGATRIVGKAFNELTGISVPPPQPAAPSEGSEVYVNENSLPERQVV
jgi:AAA family ATP:ADP antiporter